jgi:hypothetical protein
LGHGRRGSAKVIGQWSLVIGEEEEEEIEDVEDSGLRIVDDLQSSIFDPRSTIHDLQSIISYLDYNGARAFLPVSFFKSSLQSSILNPQSLPHPLAHLAAWR